jgi:hypothetical protein
MEPELDSHGGTPAFELIVLEALRRRRPLTHSLPDQVANVTFCARALPAARARLDMPAPNLIDSGFPYLPRPLEK